MRGISVRFGGIHAVRDLTLSVAGREILGIIGPNGAGKTTLFDLISGFTRNDGGAVVLNGIDVTRWRPSRRARAGLGRSFQSARLFPALTVAETLSVAHDRFVAARDPLRAALHSPAWRRSERRVASDVEELIELFSLGAYRDKFVNELSTGTRRVVDLACQVAHRPTVILLDEPSSGIAQRETEALAPLLLNLRDALGASLVVIEHDMGLVTAVADRLVALDQGQILVEGEATTVLHDARVVEAYLGYSEAAVSRSFVRPAPRPPSWAPGQRGGQRAIVRRRTTGGEPNEQLDASSGRRQAAEVHPSDRRRPGTDDRTPGHVARHEQRGLDGAIRQVGAQRRALVRAGEGRGQGQVHQLGRRTATRRSVSTSTPTSTRWSATRRSRDPTGVRPHRA